jgi:peptidoglycan/xylan/chitin deacetylase (PgdA/CDA1 family)
LSDAEELRRVRITAVDARRLEWAVGLEVSLPVSLLASVAGSADVTALDLRTMPPPNLGGHASGLRLRAAFTKEPPLSKLPFSYQRVPAWLRWYVAVSIGRRLRGRQDEWARFPAWPVDLSVDFLMDWSAGDADPPTTRPAPVCLTHDIDSPEGLRNLVEMFLPIEEAAGVRSTNYVVPCAWRLDHGLLREVVERGHDIGVHGYDHANRTAFLAAAPRQRRLKEGRDALTAYGPVGYRAPSLVRSRPLVEDVGEYYQYDSSIPTSGGPFPVFNNGCATARPFRIGPTLEIPISMRRDGSLRFLGYTPDDIRGMWEQTADTIATARGVVMILTHCEKRFSGNPPMLDAYARFVQFLAASPKFAWSTPACVARAAADA